MDKLKSLERTLKQNRSSLREIMRVIQWLRRTRLYEILKRSIDIFVGGLALLLISPLLLLVAVLIFIEDPGPVLFSQIRVGEKGIPFKFYKFRSMVKNAEALKAKVLHLNESQDGVIFKSKTDPRITKIGKVIRRFSIDELPQLYNVLIGDMTLVGPRPPVPKEVSQYTSLELKRLHVKPGITCIWQVSGRSDIPFKTQVKMDFDYISHQSFTTDVSLLIRTVKAVIIGKGAY